MNLASGISASLVASSLIKSSLGSNEDDISENFCVINFTIRVFMSEFRLTCLERTVRISYPSLKKYLPDFDVDSVLLEIPRKDFLPVELRVAELSRSKTDSGGRILIAFVFDLERKNRLVLVRDSILAQIISHLDSTGFTSRDSTLVLVGKEGSKKLTELDIPFANVPLKKLLIYDFDGKIHLIDFLRKTIVDFDKAESRILSLSNKSRLDLTSLPISERRLRVDQGTPEKRQQIIFANQLLQIPGISEKVALSVADKYSRTSTLMSSINADDRLDDLSFVSAKGETKKLNLRVRRFLRTIFSDKADPQSVLA